MGYYKLSYRTDFQGLPISVENRKGSYREWYDPHEDKSGRTKVLHPYGYIRGTLGTDGDEVDVYVGPNKKSDKVYVITQLKAPEFKAVDEQKVMLGFDSASEAKKAYLKQYDDPKFFGAMQTFTMDEFKEKLKSRKGKLIKGTSTPEVIVLDLLNTSGNFDKMNKSINLQESADSSYCEDNMSSNNGFGEAIDILKGMSARIASSIANRARLARPQAPAPQEPNLPFTIGSDRPQAMHEPRNVPVRRIYNSPLPASPVTMEVVKSCKACGYNCSGDECPRCSQIDNSEAKELSKR